MKEKKLVWLLVLIASVGLSGCFDSDSGGSGGDSDGDSGGSSSHTLIVQNNSSTSVWYLYVSPTEDSSWGSDVLGSSTIPSGSSYTHTVSNCDRSYDLRAEDSGSGYWESWDVSMSCGGTTEWSLTD